jgi:hypothetical protein
MSIYKIKGDFNRVLLLDNIRSYNLKSHTEALKGLEVVLNEIEDHPPILVVDNYFFYLSENLRGYRTTRLKWYPGLLQEVGMYILFLVHKENDDIYLELLPVGDIIDEFGIDLNLLRDLKLKFLIN